LPAALLALCCQTSVFAGSADEIAAEDELLYWLRPRVVAPGALALTAATVQPRASADYFKVYDDGSHHAEASGVRSLAAGYGAVSSATDSAAIGRDAVASGFEALAMGSRTIMAAGTAGVTVGNNVYNYADFTVAIGTGTRSGINTVDSASTESFLVATNGHGTLASSAQSVAILANISNADQAVGIGANATVSADAAVALGANARATSSSSVALGAGSIADRSNVVSIGSSAMRRQLINLANGMADSDAGSIGQLRAAVAALGGGASVDGSGNMIAPTYIVQGGNAGTVGAALSILDSGVTDNASSLATLGGRVGVNETRISLLNDDVRRIDDTLARAALYDDAGKGAISFAGPGGTRLSNVADGTDDMDAVNLKQLRASGLVGPGGEAISAVTYNADRSAVTLTGAGGSLLTGLRDGSVSAASTDAINGRQLFAFGQRVDANTRSISTLNDDVDDINDTLSYATFYDDAAKGTITFEGLNGTQLKNVADATDETDAVNLRQLRAAGLVGPGGEVIGAVTYNADKSIVALAGTGGTLITNLRAGLIAPGSTDAINGGQAWALKDELGARIDIVENQVNNIEQNIDIIGDVINQIIEGDLGFGVDGTGIDSTQIGRGAMATGDNATATGVNAIAAGGNSTATGRGAQATGSGSTALGAESQALAANSVALGEGSIADRDDSVSIGSAGHERQLTNLAAGLLETDAANVGQLNDVRDWAQQYVDGKTTMLERRIDKVDRRAAAGSAAAIAMANMPQPFAAGQNAVSAGLGTFNGQSARALGLSAISASGRWQYRMSAAKSSDGSGGAGFGVARSW
jgi:autotransporter adhesin